MWQQIIMGIIGLCAGFAIASGAVALVIGLGIIPRYAGVTKTPEHILWYEDCCRCLSDRREALRKKR